jgi:dTDP-4-amino-4,6-dideoxygalactose transaminase
VSAADKPALEGGTPVRAERLPFFRPCHGEAEITAVVQALRSGWLTIGPRTQEFRAAFLAQTGLPHGWPVNSCTSGLFLALDVLGIKAGDEVITTPNTFVSTAHAIVHCGAEPVLIDIEETTFGIDPSAVEGAITPRTRAILAVHYGGQPCYIEALRAIADKRGLLLVEDCAHAFGAAASGRPAGAFGEAAAFSFYVTKNLSMGEGGFVACRDAALETELALGSLHGMDQGAWKRYTDRGGWFYDVTRIGWKFNMTDIQAALGLVQLARAEELAAQRRRVAEGYHRRLAGQEALLLPPTREDAVHSWHLFVPRLRAGALRIDRDRFLSALAAEGISPSLHFIPVHHHQVYRERWGDLSAALPASERFYRGCFSLPLYPDLREDEQDQVCEAVVKLLRFYRS